VVRRANEPILDRAGHPAAPGLVVLAFEDVDLGEGHSVIRVAAPRVRLIREIAVKSWFATDHARAEVGSAPILTEEPGYAVSRRADRPEAP
jgi:hypothetical protein